MSYRPFQFKKSEGAAATVATVATLPTENEQTVAVVATVAAVGRENEPSREALEAAAAARNAEAAAAGQSDRWCGCGTMATVAVGRFRASKANPEGVARWLCDSCFDDYRGGEAEGQE